MKQDLSSVFNTLQPKEGGLVQLRFTPNGGSPTGQALSSFKMSLTKAGEPPLALWASDEGTLYPLVLYQRWQIPLSRFVFVNLQKAIDVWKVGLESVQTGLFRWVFLRPSQTAQPTDLRKLQVAAESNRVKVVLLSKIQVPHWFCKLSLES